MHITPGLRMAPSPELRSREAIVLVLVRYPVRLQPRDLQNAISNEMSLSVG